jgi:hypothetical protein
MGFFGGIGLGGIVDATSGGRNAGQDTLAVAPTGIFA